MERCCLVLSEVISFLQTLKDAAELWNSSRCHVSKQTLPSSFTHWHTDLVTCGGFVGEIQINILYFKHFCFSYIEIHYI